MMKNDNDQLLIKTNNSKVNLMSLTESISLKEISTGYCAQWTLSEPCAKSASSFFYNNSLCWSLQVSILGRTRSEQLRSSVILMYQMFCYASI